MSFLGRIGSEEKKFQIDISITKLETLSCNDPVCIRFSRGSHSIKSGVVPPRAGTFDFTKQQSLSLNCTLYRKKTKWLTKEAEIVVYTCKGSEKVFGKVTIDLANYVDSQDRSVSESLALEKCSDKRAKLNFTVRSTWLQGAPTNENEHSTSQMQNLDDFIGNDRNGDSRSINPSLDQLNQSFSQINQPKNQPSDDDDDDDVEYDYAPRARRQPPQTSYRGQPADRVKREERKEIAVQPPVQNGMPARRRVLPDDEDEDDINDQPLPEFEEDDEESPRAQPVRNAVQPRRPPQTQSRDVPRNVTQPRARHWVDTDESPAIVGEEAKEASSESEQVLDDDDDDDNDQMNGRSVKFGPAIRRSSSDAPQSPHHAAGVVPSKSNLKSQSQQANSTVPRVTVNTHISPSATPISDPSTPSTSSTRSSPKTLIANEIRSIKPIGPSAIFNCTLAQAMTLNPRTSTLDVPYILDVLIQAIERNDGLNTEGIFRVSADSNKVQILKSQFESGNYKVDRSVDPHVIASLIKLFLRSINEHEPLIPSSLHSACLELGQIDLDHRSPQPERELQAINNLTPSLPLLTRRLIIFISDFLVKLSSPPHLQRNRMNLHACCVVFAPAVLSLSPASQAVDGFEAFNQAKYCVRFLQHLVEHRDSLDKQLEQAPVRSSVITTIHLDSPRRVAQQPSSTLLAATSSNIQRAPSPALMKARQKAQQQAASQQSLPAASNESSPRRHPISNRQSSRQSSVIDVVDDPAALHESSTDPEPDSPTPQRPQIASRAASADTASTRSNIAAQRFGRPQLNRRQRHPNDDDVSDAAESDHQVDYARRATGSLRARSGQDSSRDSSPVRNGSPVHARQESPARNNAPIRSSNLIPPSKSVKPTNNVFDDDDESDVEATVPSDDQANVVNPLFHDHSEDERPNRTNAASYPSSPPSIPLDTSPPPSNVNPLAAAAAANVLARQNRNVIQSNEVELLNRKIAEYQSQIEHYQEIEQQRAVSDAAAMKQREIEAKEREASKEKEILRLRQEQELRHVTTERDALQKQLDTANQVINKRSNEIIELKQKARNVEDLQYKDEEIAELQQKLQDALDREHESEVQQQQQNAAVFAANEEERAALTSRIADDTGRIAALEREIETQRMAIDTQRLTITKQQAQLAQETLAMDELQEENETLRHEVDDLHHSLEEANQREVVDHSAEQLTQLHEQITQLHTQINQLHDQVADLELKLRDSEAALLAAQASSSASTDEPAPESDSEFELFEDDTDEVVDLKQRVMKMKRLVRKKNDELKKLRRVAASHQSPSMTPTPSALQSPPSPRVDHSECQRMLRSSEAKVDSYSHDIAELREQLQNSQHDVEMTQKLMADETSELQRQLHAKDQHITELVAEVKDLKAQVAAALPRTTRAAPPPAPPAPAAAREKAELARLQRKSEETSRQLLSLEQQLEAKDSQIQEFQHRLADYEDTIDVMKAEAERVKSINFNIERKMDEIDHRTEEQLVNVAEFEAAVLENDNARQRIGEMETTIAQLIEEKKALERELVGMRSKPSTPLSSPAAISSVTAQRELTKYKEALEQLKLKWETLKIDSRSRIEIERRQRAALEEQVVSLQDENEVLRRRHVDLDEFATAVQAVTVAITGGKSSKVDRVQAQQTLGLLHAARDRIAFLEKHVRECDSILRTAKSSWATSAEVVESELSRLHAELETNTALLAQATENKPVEYAQLELLHKKLLRSERERDSLQRELDSIEARLAKATHDAERAQAEAEQHRTDNELLKNDLVKQGIALKTIADDNFELKEWLRLNTKGKPK